MLIDEFLKTHAEQVLLEWDQFAATVVPEGARLDRVALRDHAGQILQTIAADLARPQSDAQQEQKSKGSEDSPRGGKDAADGQGESAAQVHADVRMDAGFPIDAMIAEYRTLRASVLRLWTRCGGADSHHDNMRDVTRFNEAIDKAIAESVGRYTDKTKRSTDLFIGVLGHDIRNPLGTISMSAEYLVRSGQLSAKAVEPIVNSAARINSVIEQVIDFTRAQADVAMPVKAVPGNLAVQVAKVLEETRIRNPARVLKLEQSGNFDGCWDEGRMGQLLSNLLSNALSYGARDRPITVRMWESPAQVGFSVLNFGTPIPPEEQERIFKPLTRGLHAEKPERREPDGLGLGLYICEEIVRAHGGTIAVESSEAKGTAFVVHLPRSTGSGSAAR